MAGFEVIVRPVVLPKIRPAQTRSLPPQDDPEKGFATIRGNGGVFVALPYSFSAQWSLSKTAETARRVDEVKIKQKDEDGTINPDNFVTVQVANKIWLQGEDHPAANDDKGTWIGRDQNIIFDPSTGTATTKIDFVRYYQRVEEADNIEIKRKDVYIEKGKGET